VNKQLLPVHDEPMLFPLSGRYAVALALQRGRPPQGRWYFGKTPTQIFPDAIPIAGEK
jgi:hypothetical protein